MQCVNINLEVVTDQMHQFRYRVSGLRIGLILATLFSAPAAWAESPDMRVRKKLIATGWDHPDSQRLLANLADDGEAAVRRGRDRIDRPHRRGQVMSAQCGFQ